MSNAISILQRLQAENLLAGSHILTQIESLKERLRYQSDEKYMSFADFFEHLQRSVDEVQRIELQSNVPQSLGSLYESNLLDALGAIYDEIEEKTSKAVRFAGNLISAKTDIEELSAAFESWFTLAAVEMLDKDGIKLAMSNVKAIAVSEFNRLMSRSNLEIDALIKAVEIEINRLKSKRQMAKLKFDMGREQVNAAWASMLPESKGQNPNAPTFKVLQPGTLEDEPVKPVPFVSRSGQVKKPQPPPEKKFKIHASQGQGDRVLEELDTLEQALAYVERNEGAASFGIEYPDGTWHKWDAPNLDPENPDTLTGTNCSVCSKPQFDTPGGVTCPEGHGGAAPKDESEAVAEVTHVEDKPEVKEEPAAEIKGTFFKTGSLVPATIIGEVTEDQIVAFVPAPDTEYVQDVAAFRKTVLQNMLNYKPAETPATVVPVEEKPADTPAPAEEPAEKVRVAKGPVLIDDMDDEPEPPTKPVSTSTVATARRPLDLDDVDDPAPAPVAKTVPPPPPVPPVPPVPPPPPVPQPKPITPVTTVNPTPRVKFSLLDDEL